MIIDEYIEQLNKMRKTLIKHLERLEQILKEI